MSSRQPATFDWGNFQSSISPFESREGYWSKNDDVPSVWKIMMNLLDDDDDSEDGDEDSAHQEETDQHPPAAKKRRTSQPVMWVNDDGTSHVLLPKQTYWYNAYVRNPQVDNPHFLKKFRLRFRLPHAQFLELSEMLEASEDFRQWHAGNRAANGKESFPIPLLLLTSLRYLGRGWTFDDLAENTAMGDEVIRTFFHCFIKFGSTCLYDMYVRTPVNAREAAPHLREYKLAGFPGGVGSTDATHIMVERCFWRLRQAHLGFKMSHTARTYNITVNHRRRILSTTRGHPARWNDKTLALFDDLMQKINAGEVMDDVIFELYDYGLDGEVIEVKYRGVWLLVDNGYLAWATTVPPIKNTGSRKEIRFSEWLESMRKDVECTFGILKGRWRILKSGIRIGGIEGADRIFLTCCALHNWLLETDGLDDKWEEGVRSDWEQNAGEHDINVSNEDDATAQVPFAIGRLQNPSQQRGFDMSGMGRGMDKDNDAVEEDVDGEQQPTHGPGATAVEPFLVRDLSLEYFRSKLITHFDIAFTKNEPNRNQETGEQQVSL
uniref:DDE Tnp4 domain-containing protein n=1 Tax=Attheya septentrionalis TaxID=420275 RepID=A0A7S2XME1_9STRA|mmetsp:Transcript_19128/g.34677  ORF Transcript_19128/g.34677 Transcript_19128/m.34677 type:complete len:549 (+) Transcript_19128:138-1784(+)